MSEPTVSQVCNTISLVAGTTAKLVPVTAPVTGPLAVASGLIGQIASWYE